MKKIILNPNKTLQSEDWVGNNAAFTCPKCGKVYIVSGLLHRIQKSTGKRNCPNCYKSTATIIGGKKSGGTAELTY